jgi:methionyl-tRNA formyltransferase
VKKLNVVFLGTPDFSVPSLDILYNHPFINLKYVISMPDRPAGRGQHLKSPEVIEYAKTHKIDFFQTDNINKEPEFLNKLESEDSVGVVGVAAAPVRASRLSTLPKLGCFNIHTSLLPKYRGAAPIQYALLNGDKETGVSIQKMVKEMDAGDIVADHSIKIDKQETGGQLYTRLKYQAALTLNDFIYDLINDSVNSYAQDHDAATFAPTLKKEDGHLHFSSENFETIFNKVRALKPWPGTFCNLNGKRLKVIEIEAYDSYQLNAGEVKLHDKKLLVGCTDKTIRLTYVQMAGKKACSDYDLANGLQNIKDNLKID